MSDLLARPQDQVDMEPAAPRRSTAVSVMAIFLALAVAAAVVGSELFNRHSSTADGDFEGETVEVLIPLAPGGGTDTWARFVGQELMNTVPGRPGFAPVNDDGGEGIIGTNRFATSAPADGTEVLVSTASTVVPWVLGRPEVEYDFDSLVPLMVNGTGGAIYARTAAGVDDVQDLAGRDRPLTFGGISATSLDLTTLVAFDLLGTNVRSVFGFEGRGPVNLALQRGEVDLDYQTTSSWESAVVPMVEDGTAVPLMSFGQLNQSGEVVRDPNFPGLPTVPEVYERLHGSPPQGEAYEAYKTLLGLTYTYQKAMWVPADTPDRTVETLQESTAALSRDPEFEKQAAEVLGGYPLEADEQLAARVREAYTVDRQVRGYIVNLLAHEHQIELD
jgi:tripartite-type tricarboxylate transporter receptor subunit TctC